MNKKKKRNWKRKMYESLQFQWWALKPFSLLFKNEDYVVTGNIIANLIKPSEEWMAHVEVLGGQTKFKKKHIEFPLVRRKHGENIIFF